MSKKSVIPEAALNQHIAVLGKTGSGKSYAVKGVVEHLLDQKRQVCVLDPTGAWWGLRLDANGKGKGYDVVLLGGKHADIPLSEKTGAAVARLVTQQGASVIIDTTGFTVGEYTRWFIEFAGTLYTTIQNPLHLVIDEAHYFMPQGKAPDIDAGKMIHAGNRLMSGGRSLGIRGILLTQRPAKLHKDALTCADTLIAMRVIAPQDRQAIKDWIDGAGDPVQGKAVLDSLAQLKKGEGWVWYPEGAYLERTSFPAIKTYDSSATPTHGAKEGPQVSQINLEEVRNAMAEAVKEAQANDPKLLRAELQKLRSELQKLQSAKPAPAPTAKTQIKEVAVVKASVAQRLETVTAALTKKLDSFGQSFIELTEAVVEKTEEAKKALAAARREGEPLATPKPSAFPIPRNAAEDRAMASYQPRPVTPRIPRAPRAVADNADPTDPDKLSSLEQRILDAIAWWNAAGIAYPTKEQTAFVAKAKPYGGHFGNTLGKLRSAGLIDYPQPGALMLTASGAAIAAAPESDPTYEEMIERARSIIRESAQRRIFDVLVEAGVGAEIPKDEVGQRAQFSSGGGHFGNVLGAMRSGGLIDYPRPGFVGLGAAFSAFNGVTA